MTTAKTWRGAFSLGSVNGPFPTAELVATAEQLQFRVGMFGKYIFSCDEVVSIDEVEPPRLSFRRFRGRRVRGGVRLRHTNERAPKEVILWPVDPPGRVIADIHRTGFIPRGEAEDVSARRGLGVRLWVILTLGSLWIVPMSLNSFTRMGAESEWILPLFLGPAFVLIILLLRVSWVQKVSLKRGRHLDELRPMLVFLAIIFGLFFAFTAT